jgi:hypothetical protein
MTKSAFDLHRIIAGILFVVILFAAADYYLELGFFGRGAKGILLLAMGVLVIYGMFFSPKRNDTSEHSGEEKDEQDR